MENTYDTFIHTDGTTCVWIGEEWFIPYDVGGEGIICEKDHHIRIKYMGHNETPSTERNTMSEPDVTVLPVKPSALKRWTKRTVVTAIAVGAVVLVIAKVRGNDEESTDTTQA